VKARNLGYLHAKGNEMPRKTFSKVLNALGIIILAGAAGAAGNYLWQPVIQPKVRRAIDWIQELRGGAPAGQTAGMPEMQEGSTLSHAGHDMSASKTAPKAEGKILYHCPMHPNYISDKPGTCPICNMDLVRIKKEEPPPSGVEVEGHASIILNPQRRQLIGVQVETARKKSVSKTIRAVGRVGYNEKAQSSVNLKFGGWVEELFVKAVGDPVRKGDPLFTVYSPELLEAQQNYLLARETNLAQGEKSSSPVRALAEEAQRSARERLLLWDFTTDQVRQIETKGRALKQVTVYSKVDGIVTARNIVLGKYTEPGRDLYEIADLSTVWMYADIYEYEIPLVKVGQKARIQVSSMPGEEFQGTVSYIYPYLNDQTRTVRVRMEFPNPKGELKPGMYSTVMLDSDLGEQLIVDESAILFAGTRNIAFIDKGEGILEPREVTVGQRVEGFAIILKGISEGEKVVTSGNFLVDSESRLKAALKQGTASPPTGHEGHTGMGAGQKQPGKTEEQKPSMPGMPGMSGM